MTAGGDVRVGVIGVGHLGQHHARIYGTLPGCRLVGVVDRDIGRAREIAGRHGVDAFDRVDALEGRVDAVSVAVPTEAHREVATVFLDTGIAVLVEKPIAPSLAEADALIETARGAGAILGVGHTERFNPAVAEMKDRVAEPRFIEAHRLGSFAPRSLDIDVVLDLMIHDIDIALDLVGAPVRTVEAIGVAALTQRADIANARVVFESGCVANLTASRISAGKTRKIRMFQRDSYLSCDCAQRSLECYRLDRPEGRARPEIVHDVVDVPQEEPLRRELSAFAAAVRDKSRFPVTGEDGRAALDLALRIAAKIEESMADAPGARS